MYRQRTVSSKINKIIYMIYDNDTCNDNTCIIYQYIYIYVHGHTAVFSLNLAEPNYEKPQSINRTNL